MMYDDPAAGLGPVASLEIMRAIAALSGANGPFYPSRSESSLQERTTLITSSEIAGYLDFADRFAMLDGGKITFSGTPQELLSSEDTRVHPFVDGIRIVRD